MKRIGLILAGGGSRRMGGRDKALATLGDTRLIDHVVARLTRQIDALLIAGPSDYGLPLTRLDDPVPGPGGPAAGLLSGARHVLDRFGPAATLVTAPVDAPFLPHDLAARLCDETGCSVAWANDRLQPAFACWKPSVLIAALSDAMAEEHTGKGIALAELTRACSSRRVVFDEPAAFLNINTPDDMARARQHHANQAPPRDTA